VIAAIIGQLRGPVAAVGRGSVGVGFDGLGYATERVEELPGGDAAWIGHGVSPAGGAVTVAGDQHRVRARGNGGRSRVAVASIRTNVHCTRWPVGGVVVGRYVGNAGPGRCRGIAQGARGRLVVKPITLDLQDRVAISIVLCLNLAQDIIASNTSRIRPGCVPLPIGGIGNDFTARAIVAHLCHETTSLDLFDNHAAWVKPRQGVQTSGRDSSVRLVNAKYVAPVCPSLIIKVGGLMCAEQVSGRSNRYPITDRDGDAIAVVLILSDYLAKVVQLTVNDR